MAEDFTQHKIGCDGNIFQLSYLADITIKNEKVI
jgi:hypothetical protein